MPPIYQTSTFRQNAVGQHQQYEYSRTSNPTRKALEDCLAALEGADYGFGFASGVAAVDAIMHLLKPGDHVLTVSGLYGGTYRLFERVYAPYGIAFSYAPPDDPHALLGSIQPETRLIWLESPTNPHLKLCDIAQVSSYVHQAHPDILIAVDNTFATPYLQQPLHLGAHIAVHSTTKYLGGHSDVVGGAVITRAPEIAEQLRFLQNALGAVPGPVDCFFVLRGIKTLAVRMERHSWNALKIATFLESRPEVSQVNYPFLTSHPQHDLAARQMKNGSGMISFVLKTGPQAAARFVESTQIFVLAESLGGVESLIEIPGAMTHTSMADSPLAVDPALIRLSVGLEAVEDLIADLEHAFATAV